MSPRPKSRRPGSPKVAIWAAVAWLGAWTAAAHPGSGIFVDRSGHVYFLDTGSGLWRVEANGSLTKIPGPAFHWMAADEDGRFGAARLPSGPGWEFARAGARPSFLLSSDFPAVMGRDGNLYYPSMPDAGKRLQILKLTPSGEVSALVTLPEAGAKDPPRWINGLAAAPDGSLYYTENAAVRRVSQGRISTVIEGIALTGCASIPGTESETGPYLRGLAVDARGAVYVAAAGCGRTVRITPDRKVETVIQLQSPWSPTGIALLGDDLYVLEFLHTASAIEDRREWMPRVRKVSPAGESSIVASITRR